MKKRWAVLLLTVLLCGLLPGCAPESSSSPDSQGGIAGFSDVAADAPYAQAVAWCREASLMNGVSAGTFDPGGTVTRAELTAVLYRAAGQPAVGQSSFTDVPDDAWYAPAVSWAAQAGIVNGSGGGSFGPGDPVSREQLAVILARYRGEEPEWSGDTVPATRAETAMALMDSLRSGDGILSPASGSGTGRLCVSFNGYTYTAVLTESPAAVAFVHLLRQSGGSVSIAAQDWVGCGKSGPLDGSIPADGSRSPVPGDLVYTQGGQLSLCCVPAAQPVTLLATLEGDLSRLSPDLGGGTVSITVSLLD